MTYDSEFLITESPAVRSSAKLEICEHKGVGHPDSICDGVAEAVCRALSREYLREFGAVQHFNVDKALLVAGESKPRFGGGEIKAPVRLILAGRVSPLPNIDVAGIVTEAAREYLSSALRCAADLFHIEPLVRCGSENLRRLYAPNAARLANDTSLGAAYAPYSALDRGVLRLAQSLRSSEFRTRFPAAGDDYKIMGLRIENNLRFTIALAFVDRHLTSVAEYFEIKNRIKQYLIDTLGTACEVELNLLDDAAATNEAGIYLTVTGLSAEWGDDGEVGRGNRVCGLITPGQVMSMEAAAGKNPVMHVGKIYNVLALEIARAICAEIGGISGASVQIMGTIGRPIAEPRVVNIELTTANTFDSSLRRQVEDIARACFGRIEQLSGRLIRGEVSVF